LSNSTDGSTHFFEDYEIDLKELQDWISNNGFKTLALQVPEGLKRQAVKLITFLEDKLGVTIVLNADPCFGACDIDVNSIKNLNLDALIHLGHAQIPNCEIPSLTIPIKFFELASRIDATKLIQAKEHIDILTKTFGPSAKLGLVASVQYVLQLEDVSNELSSKGFKPYIGTGDDRVKYPGQVLGCNFSAARNIQDEVDGFVFIGDGMFHPIGVALATTKNILSFDPVNNVFITLVDQKEKLLRQRAAAIAAAKNHSNFGILVSTKPGQNRAEYANKIRDSLSRHDLHGTLVTMNNVSSNQIDYLPFDAYINTACPRLTIDDHQQYKKTIITPIELEIVIGDRDFIDYSLDEIF
jgi:2-(3-amino-3-carboxypropyl)histidine synthase